MAVTLDAVSGGTNGTLDVSEITWQHTAAGDDRYLLVAANRSGVSTLDAHYYNSYPVPPLATVIANGNTLQVWGMVDQVRGLRNVRTFYPPATGSIYQTATSASFNGVLNIPAKPQVTVNSGTGTSPTITTPAAAGDTVITFLGHDYSGTIATIDPASTLISRRSGGSGTTTSSQELVVCSTPGAASVTTTHTLSTSRNWIMVAVVLKPDPPPPPVPRVYDVLQIITVNCDIPFGAGGVVTMTPAKIQEAKDFAVSTYAKTLDLANGMGVINFIPLEWTTTIGASEYTYFVPADNPTLKGWYGDHKKIQTHLQANGFDTTPYDFFAVFQQDTQCTAQDSSVSGLASADGWWSPITFFGKLSSPHEFLHVLERYLRTKGYTNFPSCPEIGSSTSASVHCGNAYGHSGNSDDSWLDPYFSGVIPDGTGLNATAWAITPSTGAPAPNPALALLSGDQTLVGENRTGPISAVGTGPVRYAGGAFGSYQSLLIEEGTTNWVLNPSAEVGTTGTVMLGSSTVTRDTTYALVGAASRKVVTSSTASYSGCYLQGQTVTYPVGARTFSARVSLLGDGSLPGFCFIRVRYSDGTYADSDRTNTVPALSLGAWTEFVTPTFASDATKAVTAVDLYIHHEVVKASQTYWVDAAQIEEKDHVTSYADGSLGTGYTWSGTAHNSSSTRAAASVSVAHPDLLASLAAWYRESGSGFFRYGITGGIGTYGTLSLANGTLTISTTRALTIGPLMTFDRGLSADEQSTLLYRTTPWAFDMLADSTAASLNSATTSGVASSTRVVNANLSSATTTGTATSSAAVVTSGGDANLNSATTSNTVSATSVGTASLNSTTITGAATSVATSTESSTNTPLDTLRGPQQIIGFRGGPKRLSRSMWRATVDNVRVEDITAKVTGASISMNIDRTIPSTLSVDLIDPAVIQPYADFLAPSVTITEVVSGAEVTSQLGLYRVGLPSVTRYPKAVVGAVAGEDIVSLLVNSGVGRWPYNMPPGTNYMAAAVSQCNLAGVTRVRFPDDGRVVPAGKHHSWPPGTARCRIVLDIMVILGYLSPWSDHEGYLVTRIVEDPGVQAPARSYVDGDGSDLTGEVQVDPATATLANHLVVTYDNITAGQILTWERTNSDPTSPASIPNIGERFRHESMTQAADLAAVEAYASQLVEQWGNVLMHIGLSTPLDPDRGYWESADVAIHADRDDGGIVGRFRVKGWDHSLNDGTTSVSLRRTEKFGQATQG